MAERDLYSDYKVINGFLYTSGQLPIDKETGELVDGIKKQTNQSLQNIKGILSDNDYNLEDIVKIQIYFTDSEQYDPINAEYDNFFEDLEALPTRTAVEVKGLPRKALVEMDCIAYKKG